MAFITQYYLNIWVHITVSVLFQIVGFTASVGVGKSTTVDKAINHILKLSANLDAQVLATVEANRKELERHVNRPNEGMNAVHPHCFPVQMH